MQIGPGEAEERWLPVSGFEGLYEVSNLGRVRSIERLAWSRETSARAAYARKIRARVLKARAHRGGYKLVNLSRDGEQRSFTIHELVLEAFVGPRPLGLEACHGLGGPGDNRLANLRWDTRS